MSQCLAYTGNNIALLVVLSLVLVVVGVLFVRSSKARTTLLILALISAGLLVSQATAKPASAACTQVTTAVAPVTSTTTTVAPTTTTTAAPALTIDFLGIAQGFGPTATFAAIQAPTGPNPAEVIKICESSNASNCVSFTVGASPGNTQSLSLGTSPGAVTVSGVGILCGAAIWNTPQTASSVSTNSGYVVQTSSGTPTPVSTSPTTYANGGTVYVSDWNDC